ISIKGSDTDIIRGYLDKLKIYEINLFYDKDLDIEVTPLLIEYSGHDVIEIHEIKNKNVTFQPNEVSNRYEVILKLEGCGILYNIDLNTQIKERDVLGTISLDFSDSDFFLSKKYAHAYMEQGEAVIHVNPNERKHIYISYKENNNRYSTLPHLNILKDIDLTSNILVEFNILKDDTLEFIPMLIEYDEDKKIGQKVLNIYNPEVINLKPEVKNVRLALRFSGYGELKIKSLNFISLADLPEKKQFDFENKQNVRQLLNPHMSIKEF